jgi:hypothetical protein
MIVKLSISEPEPTPEVLKKLAELFQSKVIGQFTHTFCWLQKDVAELGYGSVSEMVVDYEMAEWCFDEGLLDPYLEQSEPDFEVLSVTFPKP